MQREINMNKIKEKENIKSLLKKDFILLKIYKKSILLMSLFFLISIVSTIKSSSKNNISIYIVLISVFYLLFSLSYSSLYIDDGSRFYEYVKFLPINIKDYVKSKYYFAGIIYFIEFIIFILIAIFLFNLETLKVPIVLISAQILTGGIIINIFFKYGQEKVRFISTSLFMMSFLILLAFTKLGMGLLSIGLLSIDYMKFFPFVFLIISIIVFIIFMNKTVKMEEEKC